ncbi:MAG TPA: hypothetical protein VM677_25615 [Actinokineospora sp.]|nr:hypothetical protein [Actinokineospora sp.]
MSALWGAVWGAIGGATVEILQLSGDIKAKRGWPWKGLPHGPWPDVVAILLRIAGGSALASAAAASGQFVEAFGPFGFGAAAPLLIEKITGSVTPTVEPPAVEPPGLPEAGGDDTA